MKTYTTNERVGKDGSPLIGSPLGGNQPRGHPSSRDVESLSAPSAITVMSPSSAGSNSDSDSNKGDKGNFQYDMKTRILAALFYAFSSTFIILVNKYVLSIWNFPSANFLGLSQFMFTCTSLSVLKAFHVISYPDFSVSTISRVFPLPILFLLNTLTGLYGTKSISIPMFSVLRRLSILMTMILEGSLLGYSHDLKTKLSILLIIFGSFIAAINDLAFDVYGYTMIMLNDLFTALTGVISKDRLQSSSTTNQVNLGQWGLMYYNSLFSAPLLLLFMALYTPGELKESIEFEGWNDIGFVILFFLSSIMGSVLQSSILFCTKANSALTTTVVGCLRSVITTYYGMVAPGMDYRYSFENFVGVNISLVAGIWYSFLQMKPSKKESNNMKNEQPANPSEKENLINDDKGNNFESKSFSIEMTKKGSA